MAAQSIVIRDSGGVVFSDGSIQSKAQVQGPKGDKGDLGPIGIANNLSIGTVSTGNPGAAASAAITGTAPNQGLNLLLPQGVQGPKGDSGTTGPQGPGGYSFPWVSVLVSVTASPNTGYIAANDDARVVITLPSNPAIGDIVKVSGAGLGGWEVKQPVGGAWHSRAKWTLAFPPSDWSWPQLVTSWSSIASSADGSKLAAVSLYNNSGKMGLLATSTDSGVIWTPRDSARKWVSITSSADGSKLAAVESGGQIYTSTDYGATWTPRDSARQWSSITSSADGSKLAAVEKGGQIYTSTDSGAIWLPRDSARRWTSITSSSDGSKLAAVEALMQTISGVNTGVGLIYTSTDSGVTWTPRGIGNMWNSITSSSDGTKLAAVSGTNTIFTSINSGITWNFAQVVSNNSTQFYNFSSITSSADGSKLAATTTGGQIYVHDSNIIPTLSLQGSEFSYVEFQCIANKPNAKFKINNYYSLGDVLK